MYPYTFTKKLMHLCRSWKWESSWESAWGQPGQRKVQREVTCKRGTGPVTAAVFKMIHLGHSLL